MFILLVDYMDYNIKDPNFQLLGHQELGLKAGEPAKQLPSQKQPKNLFCFFCLWIGPQWKMLHRFFSQEIAAITNTPNDYLIKDTFGPEWKNCCHVVHLASLIELSYQSTVVTFQHRHPILLSWPLKSL